MSQVNNPNDNDLYGSPAGDGITEKLQDKTPLEVAQMYTNLEQSFGRQAQELGDLRKTREQQDQNYSQVQAQLATLNTQLHTNQQSPQIVQSDADPYTNFNERYEQDPGGALRGILENHVKSMDAKVNSAIQGVTAAGASDYYDKQKSENPDYSRREPQMASLLQKYSHLLGEQVNSPQAYELINLASQGLNRSYYEQQTKEQIKTEKETVDSEKEHAQVESSHSSGTEDDVNLLNFVKSAKSSKEIEDALGYKDD